jgi:hypothetical protein
MAAFKALQDFRQLDLYPSFDVIILLNLLTSVPSKILRSLFFPIMILEERGSYLLLWSLILCYNDLKIRQTHTGYV